jgi:hypothetical protein
MKQIINGNIAITKIEPLLKIICVQNKLEYNTAKGFKQAIQILNLNLN